MEGILKEIRAVKESLMSKINILDQKEVEEFKLYEQYHEVEQAEFALLRAIRAVYESRDAILRASKLKAG